MDFVAITLAGREYKLRYVPDDIQDICRRLNAFQPMGGGKVTIHILAQLLLGGDPDSYQFSLWAGLRHIAQYKNIDTLDAQKLVSAHIKGGGQYKDFRIGIFRALVACGNAELAPVLKALEDELAKELANAAIDVDPTQTNAEEETDPGNGSKPSWPSPTTSLTPFSSAVASESST